MTADLFKLWVDKLNSKMKRDGRSIILFLDNCTSHPDVQFSNAKLVFLPPNTTSKLLQKVAFTTCFVSFKCI